MSRYYEQDDRYRDRDYGRRGYQGRRFGGGSFDRERLRPPSRRFEEDDEQFSGASRYRERDYERRYGTGYEPGYGMSYQSRYGNRYQSDRPDARRTFDREYQPDYGRGADYPQYDREFDRDRNFGFDRAYGESQPHDRGWWERMSDEVASWFGDEAAERRRRMDELSGSHRGKGPRGYKRSDERIREDINDRLTDYSHLDASDIEVTVTDGAVVLTGLVENRWAKRYAEEIVDSVSGVKDVQNNLRVGRSTSETVDTGSELLGTSGSKARAAKGAL